MSHQSVFPILTRASMTMVLADASVDRTDLPLPGIVELLTETIRVELDDLAWVLHVVWDTGQPPEPPDQPPTEIRVPSAAPVGTYVHDQLVKFSNLWGICFDQVLIEASGVDPTGSLNGELWNAMVGLPCPADVDYIIDDPEVWSDLPATLGVMPIIAAQPVALLGPAPEAHIIRTLLVELLAIVNSSNPLQSLDHFVQDAIATRRFQRWLRRWIAAVTQIYSSTRFQPKPWPLEAVRLRFEEDPTTISPPIEANIASYSRWARAVTERRVGVALGGAGAQSYVGIPFIEQLEDAGVPIDILSGSSTGAFVAAFYSALGDRGLLRMLLNSNTIGWGVFFAMVNNIPLTWWLSWATNFVDLSEVPIPTISVSSVADSGEAYHQTSGLAGKGLMASGSLPPFVATYIGNTRLLDGGLTQDVPSGVLSAAGADLILATQPIPRLLEIPHLPDSVPVPFLAKLGVTLNPLTRAVDYYRGYLMLFRQAAHAQEQYAQVFYNATTKFSSAGTWYAGPRIAHEAANSQALKDAIVEAEAYWQALLDDAPGRVRINLDSKEVEIGPAPDIRFERAPNGAWRLHQDAEQILAEVGAFVYAVPSAKLEVTMVDPPTDPGELGDYHNLIITASSLGSAKITFSSETNSPPGPSTFTLDIII